MKPYYEDGYVSIYHGDALELTDAWDIPSAFMVTDPPYGMAHRSGWWGATGDTPVVGDESTAARDFVLTRWAPRPALVFGRWSVPKPPGVRMVLTWDKGDALGMGDLALPWKPSTEEIYVLGAGYVGKRDSGSVLRVNGIGPYQAARGQRHHPTQKPTSLVLALLANVPEWAVVVDPFMGSGTTLVAAKAMQRRAIGIELEERYCEIAAKRLAQEVLALEPA